MSGTNWGRSLGQTGPLPGINWGPSLGQTGLFLLNSTVKSPFVPVCPWAGGGSSLGRLSHKGRHKNVYVSSVYWFSSPPIFAGLFIRKLWNMKQVRNTSILEKINKPPNSEPPPSPPTFQRLGKILPRVEIRTSIKHEFRWQTRKSPCMGVLPRNMSTELLLGSGKSSPAGPMERGSYRKGALLCFKFNI